jgi:hypothetical protein
LYRIFVADKHSLRSSPCSKGACENLSASSTLSALKSKAPGSDNLDGAFGLQKVQQNLKN